MFGCRVRCIINTRGHALFRRYNYECLDKRETYVINHLPWMLHSCLKRRQPSGSADAAFLAELMSVNTCLQRTYIAIGTDNVSRLLSPAAVCVYLNIYSQHYCMSVWYYLDVQAVPHHWDATTDRYCQECQFFGYTETDAPVIVRLPENIRNRSITGEFAKYIDLEVEQFYNFSWGDVLVSETPDMFP